MVHLNVHVLIHIHNSYSNLLLFFSFFRFTLSEVLDMWDLGDGPDHVYNLTVVPQNKKKCGLSDCDSDGSDTDYEEETGYLPVRLLNSYVELTQTDHDRSNFISDYNP